MAYTTINKSSDHFNTLLYTGNKTANTTITGVGFQSDFTWIKSRTSAENHHAFDALRGGGNRLYPNLSNQQSNISTTLTSWTSDGFVTGTDDGTNANGQNFASWNWKANGAGSSNSSGTATYCTVSANTTAGFSIVKWRSASGAITVPHGLGVAPKVIIMKEIEDSGNWIVGGFGLDWNGYLILSATSAFYNSGDASSGSGRMFKAGGTEPTSTLLHTNGSAYMSSTSNNVIGYFFAEKQGYSKFGVYNGTGSTLNSPFIYTGFKPAWVMIKCSSAANDEWFIWDSKRLGYNGGNNNFFADTNDVESTAAANGFDILSNGFKLRTTDTALNGSGRTYIYMAFAEAPLVASNGVAATAR